MLTTMAFDHSRRRWFGTCSCQPVPRGLPSSIKQLHTLGPPRPFALVAHNRPHSGRQSRRPSRALLAPDVHPQIEDVVQIDVRQQRRSYCPLRSTLSPSSTTSPSSDHSRLQPFLDQAENAAVGDAVLDELHQPFVRQIVEKSPNVTVQNPVHPSSASSRRTTHPALDADCALAGSHTRIPENPPHRSD